MGIVRNFLKQLKEESPEEYKAVMKDYESEDEFVRDVIGLSDKAIQHYNNMKGEHHEYT